jgi:hypothetical protein
MHSGGGCGAPLNVPPAHSRNCVTLHRRRTVQVRSNRAGSRGTDGAANAVLVAKHFDLFAWFSTLLRSYCRLYASPFYHNPTPPACFVLLQLSFVPSCPPPHPLHIALCLLCFILSLQPSMASLSRPLWCEQPSTIAMGSLPSQPSLARRFIPPFSCIRISTATASLRCCFDGRSFVDLVL